MLVFYPRTGLEVTPGKQVTYAIIIAYIVFKTVRQKFIYFNFHHIYGETLYCSNTCVLTFVIFFFFFFLNDFFFLFFFFFFVQFCFSSGESKKLLEL